MMRMHERIARLEERRRDRPDLAAACVAAAERVDATLAKYAAGFDDAAATMTQVERVSRFSPAEHVAWTMRFAPRPASIKRIMDLHCRPLPADLSAKLEILDANC
ncbi:hypothetical protein U1872_08105 [Sphingomonas sp. RB3P16]|uniref:hypothetical protein n=1 Tax=Parasphingomonas frigoris TaxID=3096163 RepID=UPI002FC895AA